MPATHICLSSTDAAIISSVRLSSTTWKQRRSSSSVSRCSFCSRAAPSLRSGRGVGSACSTRPLCVPHTIVPLEPSIRTNREWRSLLPATNLMSQPPETTKAAARSRASIAARSVSDMSKSDGGDDGAAAAAAVAAGEAGPREARRAEYSGIDLLSDRQRR